MTMFVAGFGLVAVFYPLFATLQGELAPRRRSHEPLSTACTSSSPDRAAADWSILDSGTRQLIDWLAQRRPRSAAGCARPHRLRPAIGTAAGDRPRVPLPVLVAARPDRLRAGDVRHRTAPICRPDRGGIGRRASGAGPGTVVAPIGSRAPAASRAAGTLLVLVGLALRPGAGPRWASADISRMSHDDQAAGRRPSVAGSQRRSPQHPARRRHGLGGPGRARLRADSGRSGSTSWTWTPPCRSTGRDFDYVLASNMMEGNAKDLPRPPPSSSTAVRWRPSPRARADAGAAGRPAASAAASVEPEGDDTMKQAAAACATRRSNSLAVGNLDDPLKG